MSFLVRFVCLRSEFLTLGRNRQGSRVISIMAPIRQESANGFSWIHMEMSGWQHLHSLSVCLCVCVFETLVTQQKSIIFAMGEIFNWTRV